MTTLAAAEAAVSGASFRQPPRWAKVIDQTRCICCHACTTACKSENAVPLAVTRTYVKYVDVGVFPQTRRAFQVTRCNQCEHAPCVTACPTSAMSKRDDGIVDFDKRVGIGCKACIAACPYDAIFINPVNHSAEKCNFCAHRLDVGLEPACVVCPTGAIVASRWMMRATSEAGSCRSPTRRTRYIGDGSPRHCRPEIIHPVDAASPLDAPSAEAGSRLLWGATQGAGMRTWHRRQVAARLDAGHPNAHHIRPDTHRR